MPLFWPLPLLVASILAVTPLSGISPLRIEIRVRPPVGYVCVLGVLDGLTIQRSCIDHEENSPVIMYRRWTLDAGEWVIRVEVDRRLAASQRVIVIEGGEEECRRLRKC